MTRYILFLALLSAPIAAQTNPQTQITWPRVTGAGVPTATCPSATNTTTTATVGTPYTNTTANTQYVCSTGGWTLLASGGGSGLNQLTGDVTAGPGTGSQPATVAGLKSVPFCTGFTPTNGQAIEYTTGSSPNPCYTAATVSGGGGNTTSTSLTTNRLPKANGANSIIDSTFFDSSGAAGTTDTFTAPAVNTVINAGTNLATAVTACGSANTTIQITQTIAVGSGITVPVNCTLLFQSAGNLTGTSIVIHGKVLSAPVQIFGAGLAVTGMTGAAHPEWFGAKAYPLGSSAVATAAAAANDGTAAAATIAAIAGNGWMELRCYAYHFDTVAITTSNTGIIGDCPGYVVAPTGSVTTTIVSNAPSAGTNVVTAIGASSSAYLTNVRLEGFAVQSAVVPVSPAACVYGQYIDQFSVKNVNAGDCFYGLYTNFTPSSSHGGITGFGAFWGESVVSASSLPSGMQGIWQDSANNLGGSSLHIDKGQAACQLVGSKAGGILSSGISVTDTYIDGFATAGCNIGIDLENTGTSGFVAQDVLLTDNVLNGCVTDCLKINGMQSTSDIAPHVYVTGGNLFSNAGAVGAFIENSTNISLTNVQIFGAGSGGAGQTDVLLNTVNGFQINDNDFADGALINISLINSSNGTVTGNDIKNNNNSTGATGIKNVGSTNVSIQGNAIAGNGGSSLLNGITYDAASSNSGPWSLNTIDSATVTTPVTDAGTNNNPALVAGANITITGTWPNQTIAAAASGTGISGATAGQALIAGSATTATSSKALAGAGTGIVTGPTTATATDIPVYTSTTGGTVDSGVAIATLAPKASPTFTGVPAAPTAAPGTNTTQLATTAFVLANPGSSGLSGMTATQVAIAGSASTITSSKALAGAGTGVVTGPTTSVNNDVVSYNGTSGETKDSGILASQIVTANPALNLSIIPKGGPGLVDSHYQDNGTFGVYLGTGGFSSPSLNSLAINVCPDTSGSGTAQTCVTTSATPFTPATASCVTYTTTTTNSGAGLTLNVNSIGAKSIAIPGASGWTTTLTAGIILANKPLNVCYDGTNWNVQQTGTVASGGSITFPQTVGGTVNSGGLVYANSGTAISVSPAGTAGQAVLWGGAGTAPTAMPLNGAGVGIVTGTSTTTNNGVAAYSGTAGQTKDTGVLVSNLALTNTTNTYTAANTYQKMLEGTVATVASATTIAPVTPLVIVSGTTTVTTITAPSGTGALIGAWFDMETVSAVPFNTGGNIATSFTTTPATLYHCAFMGTTNGLWYCK